jgi:hypothetical protein
MAGLHRAQLLGFVQVEQFGELVLQPGMFGRRGVDDRRQVRMGLCQALDGGIVQAVGQAFALMGAQGGKRVGQGHGGLRRKPQTSHYRDKFVAWKL